MFKINLDSNEIDWFGKRIPGTYIYELWSWKMSLETCVVCKCRNIVKVFRLFIHQNFEWHGHDYNYKNSLDMNCVTSKII